MAKRTPNWQEWDAKLSRVAQAFLLTHGVSTFLAACGAAPCTLEELSPGALRIVGLRGRFFLHRNKLTAQLSGLTQDFIF